MSRLLRSSSCLRAVYNGAGIAPCSQGRRGPGFEAIAKNFSGTDAANLAHAYSVICLYDMGKYQEALAELQVLFG